MTIPYIVQHCSVDANVEQTIRKRRKRSHTLIKDPTQTNGTPGFTKAARKCNEMGNTMLQTHQQQHHGSGKSSPRYSEEGREKTQQTQDMKSIVGVVLKIKH